VAVEKLHFRQNSGNLGDTKCPGKPRTSFVGLPIEKFFQPVFGKRVFQQPRLFTTTIILPMLKVIWIVLVLSIPLSAQLAAEHPIDSTITDLSLHAQEFDGQLVRVQAVLFFGWEGDNFLLDPSKPRPVNMPSRDPASVWFYCKPGYDQQVYRAIGPQRVVSGLFEGYFHFVTKTHTVNGVFEPGSLQFEAIKTPVLDRQSHSLAIATIQGDVDETRRILQSNAGIRDKYGSILLFLAAQTGRADFAEELLASGADPKFTEPGGETSLLIAAWNCKQEVAKALLSHSALPNAADTQGETALIFAAQTCADGKMVKVLLDAGANPNAKTTDGNTPLMAAAGNPENVEELLKAGADPSMKTASGETVETESCDRGEKGHYQVCQLVREALRNIAVHSAKQ
jgi:Ankyrin repeats (3 copies)